MFTTQESQIVWLAAGAILAANLFAMALFVLFAKLPESGLKEALRKAIFELDRFADRMENTEKRAAAIREISEVLGWRRILIPTALIGWIIDAEVAAIRKMQRATNTPDLHIEGDQNNA